MIGNGITIIFFILWFAFASYDCILCLTVVSGILCLGLELLND